MKEVEGKMQYIVMFTLGKGMGVVLDKREFMNYIKEKVKMRIPLPIPEERFINGY